MCPVSAEQGNKEAKVPHEAFSLLSRSRTAPACKPDAWIRIDIPRSFTYAAKTRRRKACKRYPAGQLLYGRIVHSRVLSVLLEQHSASVSIGLDSRFISIGTPRTHRAVLCGGSFAFGRSVGLVITFSSQ